MLDQNVGALQIAVDERRWPRVQVLHRGRYLRGHAQLELPRHIGSLVAQYIGQASSTQRAPLQVSLCTNTTTIHGALLDNNVPLHELLNKVQLIVIRLNDTEELDNAWMSQRAVA